MSLSPEALVIGAGPAGLMAAEALAGAGARVWITEAKPSPARKFLMAGKSGLNLTKAEALPQFLRHFDSALLQPMLTAFGPEQVQAWARGLGQEVFTGSSGRVFPTAMKGSPLLRAWLARLDAQGAQLKTRWRWSGFDGTNWRFETPQGVQSLAPAVTVLALGGASWRRLGSDGAWVPDLQAKGVQIAAWQPANMGFVVDWSPHMARFFGQPVKGAALRAGDLSLRAEFVISARGLEGGGIYAVAAEMRQGAPLVLDLLPDLSQAEIDQRLGKMRAGESLSNRLRKLGLSPVAVALLMEWAKAAPLAAIKQLTVQHQGPRPLDEAISVAGGVTAASLSPELELRALPGCFACGEMLDWEAPTGGYLLTACLASGLWAGQAAARYLARQSGTAS